MNEEKVKNLLRTAKTHIGHGVTCCPLKVGLLVNEALAALDEPGPGGEFVNRTRQWLKHSHYLDTGHSLPDFVALASRLLEACDIIERFEQEKRELILSKGDKK